MALSGRVARAHLHRTGPDQEKPLVVVVQQRDRLPAAQTERGRPLGITAQTAHVPGPSDRHGNGGVRRWGGRDLDDGEQTERSDPGLLHVLLLSDASGVSLGWSV